MNHFLIFALTAGLLSPIAANANTHDTRDICARHRIGEITINQALRKLKLSIPRREEEPWVLNPDNKVKNYCRMYIKGER